MLDDVGIGSVGSGCWTSLFVADADDPVGVDPVIVLTFPRS
jgi:hypothetical protein